MAGSIAVDGRRRLPGFGLLSPIVPIGLVPATAAVVLIAWFSCQALVNRTVTASRTRRFAAVLAGCGGALSVTKGQCGYLPRAEGRSLAGFASSLVPERISADYALPREDIMNRFEALPHAVHA